VGKDTLEATEVYMTLHEFNIMPKEKLREVLRNCCGSEAWVEKMLPFIPAEDMVELLEDAEEQWFKCTVKDWKEAFSKHPRIGDMETLKKKFSNGPEAMEQGGMKDADKEVLVALMDGNKKYEEKFGYIFIVCASGRSAEEMLGELQVRLQHDPEKEIQIAADEQNKITKLRIEKLLQ
jgi:2-oxo-4-hydroxy-4-carboxy-5-ureidoimidazoline decarboxylase